MYRFDDQYLTVKSSNVKKFYEGLENSDNLTKYS